ncbi:MAG TPA: 2Fe-2S iron-sulfur cluster-binding protein [Micavibrio sp.]
MKTLKIHVTDKSGSTHTLDALPGWQVMEVLRDNGFPVKAECGGSCCCATCHVYIDPEWMPRIPPAGEDEEVMLDSAMEVTDNSRLSCQIVMSDALDGLRVIVAPNPE